MHRGQVGTDSVRWTSTVRLSLRGVVDHKELRLPLAVVDGLVLDAAVLPAGVTAERVAGRLVALRVSAARVIEEPLLRLEFVQRSPAGLGAVTLQPPVVDGRAPQLVLLQGPEGITFVPDAGLGVVQRLGFSAPQEMRGPERRMLLGMLREPAAPPSGAAVWLRAEQVRALGGVPGTLTMTAQRRARAGVWLGFGSLLGVIALWVTLKGLDPLARVEDAEEVLRQEFDLP